MEHGPFIVDFSIKHGDFPWLFVRLPEGIAGEIIHKSELFQPAATFVVPTICCMYGICFFNFFDHMFR